MRIHIFQFFRLNVAYYVPKKPERKKTSLSADSSSFRFWQQNQCLYLAPFFKEKNEITPQKSKFFTIVKTSPPQENKKNVVDVFVQIKKCILRSLFGFGSIGFVVICYYTLSNKAAFLLRFFDPFKCI